jgi:hypothetical protein
MSDGTICPKVLALVEEGRGMEHIMMPQDVVEMEPHQFPSLSVWEREVGRQCVQRLLQSRPLRIYIDGRDLGVRPDGSALAGAMWIACATVTAPRQQFNSPQLGSMSL